MLSAPSNIFVNVGRDYLVIGHEEAEWLLPQKTLEVYKKKQNLKTYLKDLENEQIEGKTLKEFTMERLLVYQVRTVSLCLESSQDSPQMEKHSFISSRDR